MAVRTNHWFAFIHVTHLLSKPALFSSLPATIKTQPGPLEGQGGIREARDERAVGNPCPERVADKLKRKASER